MQQEPDQPAPATPPGSVTTALATTLRAKRDGRLHMVDGVYALVPFVSGAYGWPEDEMAAQFPSLLENDGYFVVNSSNAVITSVYDPVGPHARDPLCWPYWATCGGCRRTSSPSTSSTFSATRASATTASSSAPA